MLPGALAPSEPKQRRLMTTALVLLLISLAVVLYRDRDFWFPDSEDAADQSLQPASAGTQTPANGAKTVNPRRPKERSHPAQPTLVARSTDEAKPPLSITRTVLPPLEVEVVAGTVHRTLRPGSNSVKVDMQPEESAGPAQPSSIVEEDVPASITVDAAEHTQMAADPTEVVSHSVQPGYPVLARQMKVQGSVILQALISRNGLIQDLRILDGPPILAKAALEAVKQWHFKPHYEGNEPVETQAKITVNFTISTN